MSAILFAELFQKYLQGVLTPGELRLLKDFIQDDAYTSQHDQLLREAYANPSLRMTSEESMEDIWEEFSRKMQGNAVVHRVHFLRTAWFRYAAAIIVILGISSYLWLINKSQPASIAATNTQQKKINADIVPGGDRATLTLADGSKIILDNTANGTLAQQGNAQVVKLSNGQLAYQVKTAPNQQVMMNTMTTPKGGQYKIQLPDGTNVWLNAASSITYPTAFNGAKREVMVKGEVYFEVKTNKMQPFIVKTTTSQVQVLGTSFNINAYENEIYKASLLEGSIKVIFQHGSGLLKPGEAYKEGRVVTTDVDQDIAWKNGVFNFNGLSLKEAMNQLERWYDLTIEYEGTIPPIEFYGKLWRKAPLQEVLDGLSGMGGIQFRIEGKKLIVSK